MDEFPRTPSPEPSAVDAGKWIGRVVIAVILAEGIWGFIVSVTNNLILPALARTMGGDVQSPLYLGKGDFNVPALFTSVLELCFAGIAAVILNSWVQRKPRIIRSTSPRTSPVPERAPSPLSVVPVQTAATAPPPAKVSLPAPAVVIDAPAPPSQPPGQFWSPPEPSAQPKAADSASPPPKAPAKPAKPKPPKEIYYNIVGEPINPTEDE